MSIGGVDLKYKKYISKVFLWRSFVHKYPLQGTLTLTCHDETNWECEGRPSLTCQATAARSTLLGISLQFLCSISRKYFLILTSLWLFRGLLTAKCLSTTGIGTGKWTLGTQIEKINRKQIIGRWTPETITRAGWLIIHRKKTFSFNYPLKNMIFITLLSPWLNPDYPSTKQLHFIWSDWGWTGRWKYWFWRRRPKPIWGRVQVS